MKESIVPDVLCARAHRTFRRTLACISACAALWAASASADELQLLWQLAPGDRDYITTGNTERGVAINPATGHVILVSRTGGVTVKILDGANGNEIGDLDTTSTKLDGTPVISSGTFALSLIGIADDGAIYGANLATVSATASFKLYRWENETASPVEVFVGDPASGASNRRWGDSFDVRGAGANTQVVIGSQNSAHVALLTPSAADPLKFESKLFATAASAGGSIGVSFGEGNTIWTRLAGNPLRHVSFDLAAGTSALLHSYGSPTIAAPIAPIGASPVYLGGIALEATPTVDALYVYDVSDLISGPLLVGKVNFPADNANGNGVGAVDIQGDRVAALDTNNGLLMYKIVKSVTPVAIAAQPVNSWVFVGRNATFSVSASGSPPLSYQWRFNGADLTGETKPTLTLNNVQTANAGPYSVRVANVGGSVVSADAQLFVQPIIDTDGMTALWKKKPGDEAFLNTDGTQRGIAINPVTGNVLLVSRTGGNKIHVLDGATGAKKHEMNVDATIVKGGTFAISMIGVAADGAVYAANLTTASQTTAFAVYRWDNDSVDSVPAAVYVDDPGMGTLGNNVRFGDTMDVRGAGANTQLLFATRTGTLVVIMTPDPNVAGFFVATGVDVVGANPGDFGLGVAFGAGNTLWGTAAGRPIRHASFPEPATAAGTILNGTLLHTFGDTHVPPAISTMAFDPANNLMVAMAIEDPDNVRLYDVANLEATPTLLDLEFFLTDNANVNGTGSVDIAGDKAVALDSNNGIVMVQFKRPTPPPSNVAIRKDAGKVLIEWTGNAKLVASPTVNGTYEEVGGATSPYEVNTSAATATFFKLKQ